MTGRDVTDSAERLGGGGEVISGGGSADQRLWHALDGFSRQLLLTWGVLWDS